MNKLDEGLAGSHTYLYCLQVQILCTEQTLLYNPLEL